MLLKLSIANYALIQELEIEFSAGFSVITGETGAGKSILLGALSLILGQRADTGVFLNPSKKCMVEGVFCISEYHLEEFFATNDLDFDTTVILRREINPGGKSRAFINDTPVQLSLLKELGDRLVNIHSQHAVITLNDANFQLAVLDNYAALSTKVLEYRKGFALLSAKKQQLEIFRRQEEKARGDRDYHHYLLDELNKAEIQQGEQDESEQRLAILAHAEEIKSHLFRGNQSLSTGDVSVLNLLSAAMHDLEVANNFSSIYNDLIDRLKSDFIDIKDVANEIHNSAEKVYFNPEEIEILTQRLDLLNRLNKKHQTTNSDELIEVRKNLESALIDSDDLDAKIIQIESDIVKLESELRMQAKHISSCRGKVSPNLEKEIVHTLSRLGMAKARFVIDCQQQELLTRDGIDKVRFLFSANAGIEINEISRIASGGELSRLMLSIKSMISQKNLLPTIIFDEIDNGVSGEVAGKVSKILKSMAEKMQVIVITHLPQIAAKGERHYWVYKMEDKENTRTFIKLLTHEQRVGEVAKMLSDETVTAAATQTAKELLDN